MNTYKIISHKVLTMSQPTYLKRSLSLFNPHVLHLLSCSFVRIFNCYFLKSLTAHFIMHHLISAINLLIHSINLSHLSSSIWYLPSLPCSPLPHSSRSAFSLSQLLAFHSSYKLSLVTNHSRNRQQTHDTPQMPFIAAFCFSHTHQFPLFSCYSLIFYF